MNLEFQVCSLELAKRLKELGVKGHKSLFVWMGVPPRLSIRGDGTDFASNYFDEFSAFTVAELGEMLPFNAIGQRIDAKTPYWVHYFEDDNLTGRSFDAITEADARAKMLVHLLEQGLVKCQ